MLARQYTARECDLGPWDRAPIVQRGLESSVGIASVIASVPQRVTLTSYYLLHLTITFLRQAIVRHPLMELMHEEVAAFPTSWYTLWTTSQAALTSC